MQSDAVIYILRYRHLSYSTLACVQNVLCALYWEFRAFGLSNAGRACVQHVVMLCPGNGVRLARLTGAFD